MLGLARPVSAEVQPGEASNHRNGARLAMITVGEPAAPTLTPALLLDQPNQGGLGSVAREDQGSYGLSSRIATLGETVLEPNDLGSGEPIVFRLEPFFPFLGTGKFSGQEDPGLPLELPGGTLSVSVRRPSGVVDLLGPGTPQQLRAWDRPSRGGGSLDGAEAPRRGHCN